MLPTCDGAVPSRAAAERAAVGSGVGNNTVILTFLWMDHLLEETAVMTSRIKLQGAAGGAEAPWFTPLSLATLLLALALLLSGCNTARGIGDDAEEAAEEVEDAID